MSPIKALLLVCLCSLSCLSASLPAEDFNVGYFVLPPHTLPQAEGRPQGAALEYFQRIASRMGIKHPSYSQYPLSRLMLMLEEEHLDMILLLGKNAERQAKFVFTHQPLFTSTPVLALRSQQAPLEIHDSEDLLPLRIGIWQGGYRSPLLNDPRLQLLSLSGDRVMDNALRMLLAGRIDAVYSPDAENVLHTAQQAGLQARIRLQALPGETVAIYSAFSKKSAAKYLSTYEQAVEAESRLQSYAQFLQEYRKK